MAGSRNSPRLLQCGKKDCNSRIKSDDQSIACERCCNRFHLTCAKFSKEAYDVLTSSDLFKDIIWCCSLCRPKVRQILETIDEMENKIKNVDIKIDELKNNFERNLENIELKINDKETEVNGIVEIKIDELKNNFERSLDNIELKINGKETEVKDIVENKIKTIKDDFNENNKSNEEQLRRVQTLEEKITLQNELVEKERRAKNLILYNIPESEEEKPEERVKDDCQKIKEILARNQIILDPTKIENIFRLGKKENLKNKENARPLLLKFDSQDYRKQVMQFCKDLYYLKDNLKISVYYSQDLTVKERKERKPLVEELKQRKKAGEKNIAIRGKEIVTIVQPFRREAQSGARRSWADLFK